MKPSSINQKYTHSKLSHNQKMRTFKHTKQWLVFIQILIILLFCLHRCFAWMFVCAPHAFLVPVDIRRRRQIPGIGVRWLQNALWVLGIKTTCMGRAASAVNCRTSPWSPKLMLSMLRNTMAR